MVSVMLHEFQAMNKEGMVNVYYPGTLFNLGNNTSVPRQNNAKYQIAQNHARIKPGMFLLLRRNKGSRVKEKILGVYILHVYSKHNC